MNWLATDKWKEQRYIDLKLYSKPEELICITFNPLKMSNKPHWNPQWEECFDMCSSNWLGASDWQKILSEVENDFDKFLLSFVKWIREALQYTKIIVVEGNL